MARSRRVSGRLPKGSDALRGLTLPVSGPGGRAAPAARGSCGLPVVFASRDFERLTRTIRGRPAHPRSVIVAALSTVRVHLARHAGVLAFRNFARGARRPLGPPTSSDHIQTRVARDEDIGRSSQARPAATSSATAIHAQEQHRMAVPRVSWLRRRTRTRSRATPISKCSESRSGRRGHGPRGDSRPGRARTPPVCSILFGVAEHSHDRATRDAWRGSRAAAPGGGSSRARAVRSRCRKLPRRALET